MFLGIRGIIINKKPLPVDLKIVYSTLGLSVLSFIFPPNKILYKYLSKEVNADQNDLQFASS